MAATLLVVVFVLHLWLGAAVEDQQSHRTLSDEEAPRLLTVERSLQKARGDLIRNSDSSVRPKRSYPKTRSHDVCSGYLDRFDSDYKCISTGTDFVMQLLDDQVTSVLLCNNFVFTPTTTIDLSKQTKLVICQGGVGGNSCVIDGSQFNPIEESAFTASGFASLFFCGVDFINFFEMQTRVFSLDGESIHADFESCVFRNNGFSVTRSTKESGGGGVMTISSGATVYFSACNFHGNHAQSGGVIQAMNASKVTMEDSDVDDNVAVLGGVMIISSNSKATLNSCDIRGGMGQYGGVVYVDGKDCGGGALKISGCDIRDNRVSEDGGVVYIDDSPWSPMSFEDCTIDSNKALHGMGGVLFASGGSMSTFAGCEVLGNMAGGRGGALYVAQDATVVLSGSSFIGNRAFASSPTLVSVIDADQGGDVLDGDHIFVASTDVELIECSTGDNVFADPSEDTGVIMLNAESACF